MQIVAPKPDENWPNDKFKVFVHFPTVDPQFVPIPKEAFSEQKDEKLPFPRYKALPEKTALIQTATFDFLEPNPDATDSTGESPAKKKKLTEEQEKAAKQKKEEARKRAMTSIRPSKEPFDFQKRQQDLAVLLEPLNPSASLAERLARHEKVSKLTVKQTFEAPDPVVDLIDKAFGLQKADYKNTVDYENFVQLMKAVLPTNSVIGAGIPTWNDYMRPSLKKFGK